MEKLLKITHLAVLVAVIKGWVTNFVNEKIGDIPGLKKASATELGGVKIGEGLQVDETGKASVDFTTANTYADNAVAAAKADLIGGAPETYDTLKEIADYIEDHKDVETALNAAIGNKANSADVYSKDEADTMFAAASYATDAEVQAAVEVALEG